MARSKSGLTYWLIEPQFLNFRRYFNENAKRGSEWSHPDSLTRLYRDDYPDFNTRLFFVMKFGLNVWSPAPA